MLTREELLNAPESEYMNADQLAFFKALLEQLRQDIMGTVHRS
ncbi:hypothetical protein [Marinobacter lutaoensis]|nr:hypothetical protein [Marinobacter lutaoensis]